MLDDGRLLSLGPFGDDRSPPRGLPPEAPLAMPPQVLERGNGRRRGWWRLLARRGG